jgi:hypothetical protein
MSDINYRIYRRDSLNYALQVNEPIEYNDVRTGERKTSKKMRDVGYYPNPLAAYEAYVKRYALQQASNYEDLKQLLTKVMERIEKEVLNDV